VRRPTSRGSEGPASTIRLMDASHTVLRANVDGTGPTWSSSLVPSSLPLSTLPSRVKAGRDDSDQFLLHLNQLIENAVGLAAAANVSTTIHRVDGHDVCRVHVEPSGHPVEAEITAADEKGQYAKRRVFFVRLNNATRAVSNETERQRYIARRWGTGS
jgi:hypothetical protein